MAFLQAVSDERKLELATQLPTEEEKLIQLFKQYYGGDQATELTVRQKDYILEALGLPDTYGNVCQLVISVLNDRLKIRPNGEGVRPMNSASSKYAQAASTWWLQSGLNALQADIHRNTLRDRISAVLVEWDQVNNIPKFSPVQVWSGVNYEASVRFFTDDNDYIVFATMEWAYVDYSEDDLITVVRLNIYEPGGQTLGEDGDLEVIGSTITRYLYTIGSSAESTARKLSDEEVAIETGGQVRSNPQVLPMPDIPIIRFENFPNVSELAEMIRQQDMVNHNLATIDISVDYHSWPMLTGEDFNQVSGTDIGPGAMIAGKNIQRVDPPDLQVMWKGTILEQLRLIAILKRWPVWVLLTDSSGNAPSGEALRRQERPLVAQIEEKQHYFDLYWEKMFDYARRLHNYYNDSNRLEGRLIFQWEEASTVNVEEARQVKVAGMKEAGFSAYTIWEQVYGMTDEQIRTEFKRILAEREQGLIDLPEPDNPDSADIQDQPDLVGQQNANGSQPVTPEAT